MPDAEYPPMTMATALGHIQHRQHGPMYPSALLNPATGKPGIASSGDTDQDKTPFSPKNSRVTAESVSVIVAG